MISRLPLAAPRPVRRRTAVRYALLHGTPGNSTRELIVNRRQHVIDRAAEFDRRGRKLVARYPEQLARIIADLHPDATDQMRENLRPEPVPLPVRVKEPAPKPVRPRRAAPPPKPKAPSIWRKHLQPFLLDNWYVAVGALMVVVGASLLAFFTWERHWAVRYTVLPALLGAFTATLAWLGSWLERQDATLTGTGAVLRGAAIALLPINFMTVALLGRRSADRATRDLSFHWWPHSIWASSATGCAVGVPRVHPALGGLLGGTLTALCALVLLRPLATTLAVSDTTMRSILGAGFYVGIRRPRRRGVRVHRPRPRRVARPREACALVLRRHLGDHVPAGVRLGARVHGPSAARLYLRADGHPGRLAAPAYRAKSPGACWSRGPHRRGVLPRLRARAARPAHGAAAAVGSHSRLCARGRGLDTPGDTARAPAARLDRPDTRRPLRALPLPCCRRSPESGAPGSASASAWASAPRRSDSRDVARSCWPRPPATCRSFWW